VLPLPCFGWREGYPFSVLIIRPLLPTWSIFFVSNSHTRLSVLPLFVQVITTVSAWFTEELEGVGDMFVVGRKFVLRRLQFQWSRGEVHGRYGHARLFSAVPSGRRAHTGPVTAGPSLYVRLRRTGMQWCHLRQRRWRLCDKPGVYLFACWFVCKRD